jgi:hypothetical protein
MVELSTLNNNDVERVNINKLKKCHHGETPTIIMIIIVNIRKRIKLIPKKMKIPNLPIYLGPIIKPNQISLDLSYGAKMMTLMRLNGCQMASQGLRK